MSIAHANLLPCLEFYRILLFLAVNLCRLINNLWLAQGLSYQYPVPSVVQYENLKRLLKRLPDSEKASAQMRERVVLVFLEHSEYFAAVDEWFF